MKTPLVLSLSSLKFIRPDYICLEKELEDNLQEPESITNELIPYRNFQDLKRKLLPVIRQCIEAFLTRNSPLLTDEDELKLTILVTWSFEVGQPLIAMLVSYLEQQKSPTCHVEFHEYSRFFKDVKDSLWIKSREELESKKSHGVNEILMYDREGRITEGLTSNFVVLMNNQIYTAPRGEVLWGTILNLVINLCQKEEIPVIYDYPRLDEMNNWQGAFITSTSRLLMPITEVSIQALGVSRSFEPFYLITHLETLVKNYLKQMSFRLF